MIRTAKSTVLGATMLLGSRATPRYSPERLEIEVVNSNWRDVTVYAEQDGTRVRLGFVRSAAAERFSLPRSPDRVDGRIVLEAQLVGSSDAFRTAAISLRQGGRVVLAVENLLDHSTHRVVSIH